MFASIAFSQSLRCSAMTQQDETTGRGVLTLDCPAKVNLALGVASPQPDGMHPLASVMVALTFADTLTLTKLDGPSSRFALTWASDAPVQGRIDWPLEKDLMFRAHQLLEAHVGHALPVAARLVKRIPTGAGLGGGSSDAAAMLAGLVELFGLSMADDELTTIAQKLGSDVPFLVHALMKHGLPAAIVQGLGEKLTPIALGSPVDMVLVFPQVACPTGQVYKTYDQLCAGQTRTDRLDEVTQLARALQADATLAPDAPFNDLAAAACHIQPRLKELQQAITQSLDWPVHVTGSGSTLYLIAKDAAHADALGMRIASELSLPCVTTRTV